MAGKYLKCFAYKTQLFSRFIVIEITFSFNMQPARGHYTLVQYTEVSCHNASIFVYLTVLAALYQ
jgi:hypothetical protein